MTFAVGSAGYGDAALRSATVGSGDSERSATLLAAALLFQMSGDQKLSDRQFDLFWDAYYGIRKAHTRMFDEFVEGRN